MRTIFITSFHPFISRNILSTAIPRAFAERGWRVVILAPDYKRDFFSENFSGENIIIEGIKSYGASKKKRGLFFKRLGRMLLNTETAKIQKREKLELDHKFFYYYFFCQPLAFFGRFKPARHLFRLLNFYLSPAHLFDDLLDKYRPDLIFSADPQNENDVSLMIDARRRKIKTVGMIRSWDNLTVHGYLRILPDRLLVNNETLKQEAIKYHDIKEDDILAVGIPHYDKYVKGPTVSRADFFQKIKSAFPDKKLILFAPMGDRYIRDNKVDRGLIRILSSLADINILVRLPPTDTVNLAGLNLPANVIFDQPGQNFKPGFLYDQELSPADDEHLINSLYYSDLVISGGSTLAIDAAVCGRPMIIFNFDGLEEVSPEASIRRYLRQNHLRNLIAADYCAVADGKEEFIRIIGDLLKSGGINKDNERERLVKEQCYKLDGQSSSRTVAAILGYLKEQLKF